MLEIIVCAIMMSKMLTFRHPQCKQKLVSHEIESWCLPFLHKELVDLQDSIR